MLLCLKERTFLVEHGFNYCIDIFEQPIVIGLFADTISTASVIVLNDGRL
jgi:hypothetical protein